MQLLDEEGGGGGVGVEQPLPLAGVLPGADPPSSRRSSMPARRASISTASEKSRCSISRTNVIASPEAPQPKHL